MKELINDCLSNLDLTFRVNVKEVNAMLDYYRVLYRTSDSKYHKLELFYNSSMIFSKNPKNSKLLLGSGSDDFRDFIYNSIEDYSSYEDCAKEMKTIIKTSTINSTLHSYLEDLTESILGVNLEGIEIKKVSIFLKPIACIVVMYSLNRTVKKPLKLFIGEDNPNLMDNVREKNLVNFINNLIKEGF